MVSIVTYTYTDNRIQIKTMLSGIYMIIHYIFLKMQMITTWNRIQCHCQNMTTVVYLFAGLKWGMSVGKNTPAAELDLWCRHYLANTIYWANAGLYWPTCDARPTLTQHWLNVSCFLGTGERSVIHSWFFVPCARTKFVYVNKQYNVLLLLLCLLRISQITIQESPHKGWSVVNDLEIRMTVSHSNTTM